VRIIVSFPPGGANDIHARLMGQYLSERLGQPFIVENRPGAGGNIGAEMVVRSAPDGHTLLFVSSTHAINRLAYEKLNYDLLQDVAPVIALYRSFFVMLVNPASPVRTVPEFIAYAKANAGKIALGSNGIGATGHLCGELFKMLTGIEMLHVPYRCEAPALGDLISGHVQVVFASVSSSIEFARSGQLRALAVTSPTRAHGLPDVPTVGESVAGYDISTWGGIGAPHNTPAAIVDKLNKDMNAGLQDPKIKARYDDLSLTVFGGPPAAFGKTIADDLEKWSKVVKFAGIKLG
jgi:tripartite-type tricarboxylate transporter receptor subunit TctC